MIIEASLVDNVQTIAATMEETDLTLDANLGTVHVITNGDYDRGYADGEAVGYEEGHADGYLSGKDVGYEKGHADGYAHGHSDGWGQALSELVDPMRKYYNNETNDVVLPAGVTTLRASAFRQHALLTNVSGLDDVTTVDSYAFADCKALTGISLPNATRLNSRAFYACTALASIYMPKVARIQNQVFYNCTSLTNVTFQSTPTSIDSTAFTGCTNLVTINVPWAEGAVAGAPWGAPNATINYNYKGA